MDLDTIREICKKLPAVTEDIKWGNDLCFLIGGKMFCVIGLETPTKISIKVKDDEFDEMTQMNGIIPAPYVAKHKWILIENTAVFNAKKWGYYIRQSYDLVKSKLTKKLQAELN